MASAVLLLGLHLSPISAQITDDSRLAQATLVIYNSEVPVSRDLATHYARHRAIPAGQVMGLSLPLQEEISRQDYVSRLERPLRKEFFRNDWWQLEGENITAAKIRFVVLMHGVPLKIAPAWTQTGLTEEQKANPLTYRDEASVDSELAAMGFLAAPNAGAIKNFYFRSFRSITQAGIPPLLLVTRLDASHATTVKRMIDDALHAEKYGLFGWHVIDWRGNNLKDAKATGDAWLNAVVEDIKEQHLPNRLEGGLRSFQHDPLPDMALYFGWYDHHATPAFLVDHRLFRPGAIAVHIHSFSAASLQDARKHWVGPLLERGAAVSLGNVYEPYLGTTHHLDVFYDRLKSGMTLAEAAYASVPVLSWMSVVYGDPLYRPYNQDRALFADPSPIPRDRLWAGMTEAWKAYSDEGPQKSDEQFRALREKFPGEQPRLNLLQGALAAIHNKFQRAVEILDPALENVDDPVLRARMVAVCAHAYYRLQQTDAARVLLESELQRAPDSPYAQYYWNAAGRVGIALPEHLKPAESANP